MRTEKQNSGDPTDLTFAKAGAGNLAKLAAALGSIAQEFGEWTVDVQRQNEIAVVLVAAADVLNAHRCTASVPGDTRLDTVHDVEHDS